MKRWAKIIEKILRDNKRRKQWNAVALVFSCVVVFITTYSLILPAITMEQERAQEMAGFDLLIDEVNGSDGAGTAAGAVSDADADGMLSDEISGAVEIEDTGAFLHSDSSDDLLIDDLGAYDQPDDVLVIDDDETGNGTLNGSMTGDGVISGSLRGSNSLDETTIDDLVLDPAEIMHTARKQVTVEGYIPHEIPVQVTEATENILEEETEEEPRVLIEDGVEADSALEEDGVRVEEDPTIEADVEEETEESAGTIAEEKTEDAAEAIVEAELKRNAETIAEEETEELEEMIVEEETEEPVEVIVGEETEVPAEEIVEEETEAAAEVFYEEKTEETSEAFYEEETEEAAEALYEEETEETTEALYEEETEEAAETLYEDETEEAAESLYEEESEEETETVYEEETEEAIETVLEEMPEESTETVFEEETEAETEIEPAYPARIFTAAVADLEVKVYAGEGAFPDGTTMTLRKVEEEEILHSVADSVEETITGIQAVDITFRDSEGNEIEPLRPIRVQMTDKKKENKGNADSVQVVHVDNDGNATPINQVAQKTVGENEERVSFNADAFSVYVLVYTQISTHVITADGEDYIITVTYGPEAGIPDGATLKAEDIREGTAEYEDMLTQSQDALTRKEDVAVTIHFSRFFDVSILDTQGNEIEPESPVSVSVQYAKAINMHNAKPTIVHFAESGIEVIEANGRLEGEGKEGTINVFEYEQGSFSGIGTIVNSSTIADGKYFMIHATGGKQYALTTSGGTVEVDYNSSNKTVKAKDGTDESTLLWNIKHVGNGYYSLHGDNGKYIVLGDNGQIVGDSMEYIYPFWYDYDPYTQGSQGDGYSFYNVVNAHDRNTWIPLSFTDDLKYTTGGTATRVRLAKYSIEAAPTGQPPAVNTYTGHPVDPKEVNDWLMSLFDDMPIGRFEGYSKTAEVYDYENRIYSVDFTARSNSQGVMSNLDIAFSVDMSNSMLFPKAMTEIGTVDMNQNAVATMLAGRENEVFFVVSDIPNTYTVNAIFYEGGKWKYEDASKWARGQRGGKNQDYIIPDSTTRISTKKDSNNHYYDTGTYTIYTADGNYVNYVKNNDGAVWDNPDNRLSEMKTSLQIAFNFLNEMSKKYKVKIRVGWNGFASDVTANKTGTGNNTEIFNYSANPNDANAKGEALTDLANVYWMDMIRGFADAGAQTGGGTRPDKAFQDAIDYMGWDSSSSTKRVLVLITDGAPQGGSIPNGQNKDTYPLSEGKSKGRSLSTQKNVDIVSIGLSTEHIDSADNLFQYISASDAEGRKLVYQAKDGDVLRDAIMDTLRQMVEQAITIGTIQDTIDPAFYPVSTDGTPLKINDKIDLNGKLTTDTSKPYGVIGWDNTQKCWTVKWSEQDIVWPDDEHPYGWHGRVLVKAKENFLGGNDISTNKGQASLDVVEAKVKTTKNPDGSWNYKRVPFSTLVDLDDEQLATRYMDTPHVNVDELEMTKNDTEWTVYLNTEVDPGKQMEALFNEIKVMKVVTDGVHEMVVPNGKTAKDTMVYDLIPKETGSYSYEEAASDTRDKRDVDQAFFYLKDLFSMKDSLDHDFILDNMTAEQAIAKLLAGEKVEVKYQGYGHGTADKPVGKIILELKADPAAQVDNLNKHNASPEGNTIEKYILSAEYKPTPEEGSGDWYWNTGSFGTKARGVVAEDKTKYNNHIINVIKRIFTIKKVNSDGNPIETDAGEAKFEVYQKDDSGNKINPVTVTTSGLSYTWDYVVPEEDQKIPGDYWKDATTYYIKEVEAPKGYAVFTGEIPVTLNIDDTAENVPNRGDHENVPFNWTQTASLTAGGDTDYVTVTGSPDITIAVKNDKSIDINVIKTDNENVEISGAKFTITKGSVLQTDIKVIRKGGSWDTQADRIPVENGVFTIPKGGVTLLGLGAGDYTLTETEPPAGYIKTLKPVTFTAGRDGAVTYTNTYNNKEPGVKPANNNKQYTIQNEPGAALPNTGGHGTALINLLGIMCTGLAGAGLVMRKLRKVS